MTYPKHKKQVDCLPNLFPQQFDFSDKLYWEKICWRDGYRWVAGLDEAGRGAWAGPVAAAAVIFPPDVVLPEIDDSKKLTAKQRNILFDVIREKAHAFAVGLVSETEIDGINILNASIRAMQIAVKTLSQKPDFLLVDGNRGIDFPIPQRTLVKGDGLSQSIGAASILAKVTRDRLMIELEKEFPGFRFGKHKGYGTREHQEDLRRYGVLPCHRKSFAPIRAENAKRKM